MISLFQTFFGKTYIFTDNCIDLDHDATVEIKLAEDANYCVKNQCWDTSRYPFCLCRDDADKVWDTGCDSETEKFGHYYVNEETAVYNGSFANPLIAMVRLMVLISTENYPDVMRELIHILLASSHIIWTGPYFQKLS